MASGAAWDWGARIGANALEEGRARKNFLSDQDHAIKREQYLKDTDLLKTQLNSYVDDKGQVKPEYKDQYNKAMQALAQNQYQLHQLYDPTKAPGRLQADWHYLRERVHGIKQPDTPAAPRVTQAGQDGSASTTLPGMQGDPTSIPATGNTPEVLLGGAPAPITSPELPAYKQASVSPAAPPIKPVSWRDAELRKRQALAMQKAQQEAGLLAAGAGLSPEQQAVLSATTANAGELARIRGQIQNYKALNPNATSEDVAAYSSSLMSGNSQIGNWERVDGTLDGQPYAISYDKKRGVYKYPDGTISSNQPENFKPTPKTTGATAEQLKEYNADTDPNKGSFPQWIAAQRAKGSAAGKPQNKDDRYIAINQRKALGQQLTPDEQAYLAAFDLWTQKTKVEPGVARAAAFGAMRYIPVVDPSNPENVIMMRAGEAARAGVNTPASIGFKTDQAITRYMTSGAGGTNINYFNTATDHLKLLAEAGEALNNGDTQLFNRVANQFATATGDPAPSNFETVKAAVAGELSKTFKGTGATDSEIADINTTINQAQSPQQINGAIGYYTRLMGSKVNALKTQYEAAKRGQPNFPGTSLPSNPSSAPKKKVSLAKARLLPSNKGKTDEQIKADIEAHNHEVIP